MIWRTFAFGVGWLGFVLMMCTGAAAVAADSPIVSSSKDVKWGPAPPILPKGAVMAVMAGDPGATGLVAVRLKMPAGYKIPAHWHPTDEQVTVVSGTLAIGMGDKLDETKGVTLRAGRRLPRQGNSLKLDSRAVIGLGINVRGGTRPRLSCGRSSLYSRSQASVTSRTCSIESNT